MERLGDLDRSLGSKMVTQQSPEDEKLTTELVQLPPGLLHRTASPIVEARIGDAEDRVSTDHERGLRNQLRLFHERRGACHPDVNFLVELGNTSLQLD